MSSPGRPFVLALVAFGSLAHAGGTIAGKVAFLGTKPELKPLELSADAQCQPSSAADPQVVFSADGKSLANVVVRLSADTAPKSGAPAPSGSVVVTQHGCLYAPHVQTAVKGQKVEVKNTDPTMHNVHAYSLVVGEPSKPEMLGKTLFNVAQPPGSKDVEKDPKADGVVRLKCDVHPWMSAWIIYSDHPFATVTDATGHFSLEGVPPGKYTVEAWHERFGTVSGSVTVDEGKSVDPKFSFSGTK